MIPIQLKTTRHGCVTQTRIQRASGPVDRRSCADVRFRSGSVMLSPLVTADFH